MNTQAIGIFDSGVGGITIWKTLTEHLPYESTYYLADSKNAPYGQNTKEKILNLCIKNTEFLIAKGCKIIVVACNTATTNTIEILRERYAIPFIGIEPAIKPAALKTKNKSIGILATKGTLSSRLFNETSKKYLKDICVTEQIGEGLVELIEKGKLESSEVEELLETFLLPMLKNRIDCLVLGCTHYPFLISKIKKITGDSIEIIDSGLAVAKQTKFILAKNKLLNPQTDKPTHHFYTNSELNTLKTLLNQHEHILLHKEDF
jgi:glutamate racemase